MEAKKSKKSFRQLFEEAEARDDYWAQRAALRYTEAISDRMATLSMSRASLARALDRSPAYVTKLLRGDVNFTLSTMVRLARVLGAEFQPTLVVKEAKASRRVTLAGRWGWDNLNANLALTYDVSSHFETTLKTFVRTALLDFGPVNVLNRVDVHLKRANLMSRANLVCQADALIPPAANDDLRLSS